MLEIIGDDRVEVKLDYIFPLFQNEQTVFINDNCDRMIVKLEFSRVFVYKLKARITRGADDTHKSQWELLRQLSDYPFYLDNKKTTCKLEPFTKDFSLYVRYNKKEKQFEIRHLDTGENHSFIPTDILGVGESLDLLEVINRFRWLDSNTFVVVSEYGLEKIININHGFKEESFNQRPLFNEINQQQL